jgi:DNA uptake protein ComE-like DNA-binding protein
MVQRRWLDPLARRLLVAMGEGVSGSPNQGQDASDRPASDRVRARQSQQTILDGDLGTLQPGTVPADDETIEQDLLALRLRLDPSQPLRDARDVRRAAALGWRLDVNRATPADWQRLPGCGADQIDLLQRLQAGGVQLSGAEDLKRVLDLDDQRLECWLPVLTFRWYGDGAVGSPELLDLNRTSARELRTRLCDWTSERRERLLQERRRRPFRDLADLQQRLDLPASTVEMLIGRVSFGRAPAGPTLPPPLQGRRRSA